MQIGATWCSLVQLGAFWCSLVELGGAWCRWVHFGQGVKKVSVTSTSPKKVFREQNKKKSYSFPNYTVS